MISFTIQKKNFLISLSQYKVLIGYFYKEWDESSLLVEYLLSNFEFPKF